MEGAGLAVCEDGWPRPLLRGRRPRWDFDSQLTIVEEGGNEKTAQKKNKSLGQLQGVPWRQSMTCKRTGAVVLARCRLSYGRFFKPRESGKLAAT